MATAPQIRINQIRFYWLIWFKSSSKIYITCPLSLPSVLWRTAGTTEGEAWSCILKGDRTILDAWELRLIPSERRCRVKRWQIGSPRRSTAWRDPRCPERCARPPHTNRQLLRKNTWNVSHLSIDLTIYLSILSFWPSSSHAQIGHHGASPMTHAPVCFFFFFFWASLVLIPSAYFLVEAEH